MEKFVMKVVPLKKVVLNADDGDNESSESLEYMEKYSKK
jgi:hypothetical protein